MTTTTQLLGVGLLLMAQLVGCGGASADYQQPALPPPPPPPPAVEPAPIPEPYSEPSSAPPAAGPDSAVTPAPPAPPPAPGSTTTPPAPPPAAAQTPPGPPGPPAAPDQSPAPPSSGLVYSYPTGQWVYTSGYGWVWVPADTTTEDVDGVPYVHIYTPAYGWTWYVSPWGWGPYHYGIWVRHPWHPPGWHGRWVAHPRVIVRLGPHYRRR